MATGRRGPNLHVVLLAGGSGTRFWPLSRSARPKQFLSLAGSRTLLAETWRRVRKLAPAARIWVVAPKDLVRSVRDELPQLKPDRLVVEPSPRDTGPAIGLACTRVFDADPGATVAVFPTDHVIRDSDRFVAAVRLAAEQAASGSLVCLGIRPDRPATGFGYLRCKTKPRRGRATDVERFIEKPDLRRARRFLAQGNYLWNAGMFVWRADAFLDEMQRLQPRMAAAVNACVAGKKAGWSRAPKLSVDYAVMERARNVRVVPLDAGWDDIGSWDAAARLLEEADVGTGDAVLVDSDGSAVVGAQKLVALVDVPGVIVVDTPDALLVVSRDNAERVREVFAELRRRRRKDLL